MKDPTRDEMIKYLRDNFCAEEFDIEEAIYWFASNWHGGQSTNLYSTLSTSHFNPGMSHKPADDTHFLYKALKEEFTS